MSELVDGEAAVASRASGTDLGGCSSLLMAPDTHQDHVGLGISAVLVFDL